MDEGKCECMNIEVRAEGDERGECHSGGNFRQSPPCASCLAVRWTIASSNLSTTFIDSSQTYEQEPLSHHPIYSCLLYLTFIRIVQINTLSKHGRR